MFLEYAPVERVVNAARLPEDPDDEWENSDECLALCKWIRTELNLNVNVDGEGVWIGNDYTLSYNDLWPWGEWMVVQDGSYVFMDHDRFWSEYETIR